MHAARVVLLAALAIVTPIAAQPVARVDGPPETVRDEFLWRVYRSFGTSEGLPNQEVLALVQDPAGRIYAGTGEGMARYDGVAWETVALPAASMPTVRALAIDRDGQILVGTDSHGLWRLDPQTDRATRLELPAGSDTVLDLSRGHDGVIWVAADRHVLRCRGGDCEELETARDLGVYRVLPARWQGRDVLWLGLDSAGVRRVDDPDTDHPRLSDFQITRADGLPNDSVRALVAWGGAHNEDLWIGVGRGIARWNGERLTVYGGDNGFPVAMVFAFQPATSISGRRQLYAALRPGGLATFRDDGTWILQGLATGLASNDVQSLMISATGSSRRTLWIGTIDAGITRRDPGQFTALDERIGIPSRHVYGVGRTQFLDGIESPWVGTVAGARRWLGGRWQTFMPPAYDKRIVRDLVRGDDGALWAATDRQLLRIDGTTVRDFNVDNSKLPAIGVNRLARLGHGAQQTLWIGTGHGLARYDRARGLVNQRWGDAISADAAVLSLSEDLAGGRVHVGLEDGLVVITAAGFKRVAETCIKAEPVHDIAVMPGSTRIFVATRTRLLAIDPEAGDACREMPLLADSGVLGGLLLDQSGRLYVFSSRIVQRLALADVDARGRAAIERFDREDGLQSTQLRNGRSLWLDSENRLYAATSAGLAAFEPEPGLAEIAPARLYLQRAERGDGTPLRDGDVLPADANEVRFDYRLLSFEREHRIRYHTELRGLADSIGAWLPAPSRRFDRLPPGPYTFIVSARSADGRETAPLALSFRVLAPWWRQPWALALFALLLVASGIGFGLWRTRATEARARELEHQVTLRTQELAEANTRLEHASLTDPLTGLGNRRHFALATEGEVERAARRVEAGDTHAFLLLMLIDVDHFKRVNDTLGHAAGDRVLATIAQRIDAFARAGDVVARFGGEEFILLARDVTRDAVQALLLRCLHAISDAPIAAGDLRLAITVSIGAVTLPDALAGSHLDEALSVADDALYTAKQAGRDRACLVLARGEASSIAGRPAKLLPRSDQAASD